MTCKIQAWIEAMRLRTLPVSTAGVLLAWALAWHTSHVRWLPALLCMVFAILCQIVSNFANEYYDYRDGIDKPGRSGPRRGVAEGDIRPMDMKIAAFTMLFIAVVIGLWLMYWGGLWLIVVGIAVVLGAIAYSAGPYPLSRHGLGEIAVVIFFGIIPVNITFYIVTGVWRWQVVMYSLTAGLMAANVLIVNNYRDADEDMEVGKRTLANIMGRRFIRNIYLVNGIAAFLFSIIASGIADMMWIASVVYLVLHLLLWEKINLKPGMSPSKLNPYLGATACAMLLFSLLLFI